MLQLRLSPFNWSTQLLQTLLHFSLKSGNFFAFYRRNTYDRNTFITSAKQIVGFGLRAVDSENFTAQGIFFTTQLDQLYCPREESKGVVIRVMLIQLGFKAPPGYVWSQGNQNQSCAYIWPVCPTSQIKLLRPTFRMCSEPTEKKTWLQMTDV